MNRAERRRAVRDRRQWLVQVEKSSLPTEAKMVARALAKLADDDGTVTIDVDEGDREAGAR